MTLAQQYKQFVIPLLEATFKQVVGAPFHSTISYLQNIPDFHQPNQRSIYPALFKKKHCTVLWDVVRFI